MEVKEKTSRETGKYYRILDDRPRRITEITEIVTEIIAEILTKIKWKNNNRNNGNNNGIKRKKS